MVDIRFLLFSCPFPFTLFHSKTCNCELWMVRSWIPSFFHAIFLPKFLSKQVQEWILDGRLDSSSSHFLFLSHFSIQKHPAGSFTGPRLCWNLSLTTVLCCFFYAEGSLKFFKNSDVSSTLAVFCVLKRVGYTHPFFPTQSFASVCPVKARRSLSWHSQRHCWLLIYIQRDLLGFPPSVLVMEFGTADFSKVQ